MIKGMFSPEKSPPSPDVFSRSWQLMKYIGEVAIKPMIFIVDSLSGPKK